jgi:hypothetical protein
MLQDLAEPRYIVDLQKIAGSFLKSTKMVVNIMCYIYLSNALKAYLKAL